MTRADAIALIVQNQLQVMSVEEREHHLLNWWTIDPADGEYSTLPQLLRAELEERDAHGVATSPHYDPLLRLALRRQWLGVRNEYLAELVKKLGHALPMVTGTVETLLPCPCCGYLTIEERGNFEICKVCFWEDDGSDAAARFSGPNRMTLQEARESFAALGAVSSSAASHVLDDGRSRYVKGTS